MGLDYVSVLDVARGLRCLSSGAVCNEGAADSAPRTGEGKAARDDR